MFRILGKFLAFDYSKSRDRIVINFLDTLKNAKINIANLDILYTELRFPEKSANAASDFRTFQGVHSFSYEHYKNKGWHTDGFGWEKYYLILWSNIHPTEVRNIKTFKPILNITAGDILMFDNSKYEHRPPIEAVTSTDRYFIRAIYVPKRYKKDYQ